MGVVYEAEEQDTGRRVALKVLGRQFDSPADRARFLREGRLAASINHPNSVYVYGTEEIDGTPTIAMELVSGGTLQQHVKERGSLPVSVAVEAILDIIAGLEAAQAIGILHRDIKPGNCFEESDGTIKIGDFGLSISTAGRAEANLTASGAIVGTPAFCSPEQLRGEELSARSDMYSVGGTLFYLLTGRMPFEGHNLAQLTANVLEKPVPSPSDFRKEIPKGLAHAIRRCLAKQPAERFKSYDDLRQALAPYGSAAPTPATLSLRFLAGAGLARPSFRRSCGHVVVVWKPDGLAVFYLAQAAVALDAGEFYHNPPVLRGVRGPLGRFRRQGHLPPPRRQAGQKSARLPAGLAAGCALCCFAGIADLDRLRW